MALFQKPVLNKYLKLQDTQAIEKAYKKFSAYFHNSAIQQNIKESKEEQFQQKFLIELFDKVFGYTIFPDENSNLTTEFKNLKGAKKADGAILIDGKAIAVVELKGTKTKDLESIRQQAFDYKSNHPGCVYIITSNFEKLRFYINSSDEHLEFNLFTLTLEEFKLMYLCLDKQNLLSNTPLKIKEESIREEENITKKFYSDYSIFKRELYRDLVKLNIKNEVFRSELTKEDADRATKNIKLTLFKKSQKLIDRFLFIFFGEDRGLLPPNSTLKILEQWNKLKELDEIVPLYSRFIKYFNYLDKGRKGTDKTAEIFAYNGGLFKPDPVLDSMLISDELLYKHTKDLSIYNFDSQIDVNILGHIFENSLNEIESVNAEIEGVDFDKQTTKRKKDGVFYTPKYITKYIVDNTVGKLCTDKKTELGILEEEYFKSRKGRTTKKLKELQQLLNTYRDWLLTLTILDPACGSGAFLNQALDFLIKEHQYIDELDASLTGQAIVFRNIENTVLENNIYGVDLNEESVEIAKLSLWLRTAQPRRQLTTLSSNIKCGNSLIDDPKVAGDKAFNWQKEFPAIFAKGGFDVVIGNPPYGASVSTKEKDYYKKNYKVTEYNFDTYNFFFEKSIDHLKNDSLLGFITPNTFLVVENGKKLRELIFKQNTLIELFEVFNVFPDAVVEPINIILKKTQANSTSNFNVLLENRKTKEVIINSFTHSSIFKNESLVFNYRETKDEGRLYKKIKALSNPLVSYAKVTTGIKPYQKGKGIPKQDAETVKNKLFTNFEGGKGWYPLVRGTQVNRYLTKWNEEFILYGEWLAEPRKPEIFFNEKLLIRRTDDTLMCTYDDKKFIGINSVHSIQSKNSKVSNKYLLSLINSKVSNWFFRHENFHMVDKPLAEVKVVFVERLPIITSDNQSQFTDKVNLILLDASLFQGKVTSFSKYLKLQFTDIELSKKLQNWNRLEFGEFITELNKSIKKEGGTPLTKTQEMDWMEVFETKKAEAQTLKTEIDKTDSEIDRMVYELYNLTEEEIAIVENS